MSTIKIVLVDDHTMFLDGVKKALDQKEGIEVLNAFTNANHAITFFKTDLPDLLITDISMPELNGIEFIKIVKEKYPKLKILVVSMFKQIQSFNGVDGHLLKETTYDELTNAIDIIVNKNQKYFYQDYIKSEEDLTFNKTILSRREREIITLIGDELTTDDIAEKLILSKHTIETHKKNIYLKLQVNNVAGLIKKAIYLGYIS